MISRVNWRVEYINYENVRILDEISFMSVSLVRIQVDYHDSIDSVMSSGIMHNKSYIRVYTESSTVRMTGVMIPSSKIYSPAICECHAGSVDRALSRLLHGL